MSRAANSDPRTEICLSLPSSIMTQVDLLFFDEVTEKVAYGARRNLVTHLLENWLKQVREGLVNPNDFI